MSFFRTRYQEEEEEVSQVEVLNRLKEKIANSEHANENPEFLEDIELCRFLKARRWDVDAAFDQFSKTMKWRKEYNVDSLLDGPYPGEEIYQSLTPHMYKGFDKQGNPLYWERTGVVDLPNLLKYVTAEDLVRRHVWHMELQVRNFFRFRLPILQFLEIWFLSISTILLHRFIILIVQKFGKFSIPFLIYFRFRG
jgi:hypothetical protein